LASKQRSRAQVGPFLSKPLAFQAKPLAFQAFSEAMFANKGYKNDPTFSLFIYVALAVFFNLIKFLRVISHRNKHYASGLQLFQQRLRDIRSCTCHGYPVIRGILRITH
jgi:hypothetical protein